MADTKRQVKQVIIIRRDLRMRQGKAIAQGAHACLKIFLDHPFKMMWSVLLGFLQKKKNPIHVWVCNAFTKICLQVSVEQELIDLYELAQQANIPTSMIIDSGKTEFHNVPTRTCIAIGPWWSDEIDHVTGHLELL